MTSKRSSANPAWTWTDVRDPKFSPKSPSMTTRTTPPLNIRSFRATPALDPIGRQVKTTVDVYPTTKRLTKPASRPTPAPNQETLKGKSSAESADSSLGGHDIDSFSTPYRPSSALTSYEHLPSHGSDHATPNTHDTNYNNKRNRNRSSFLGVATDALNFTFGRKRKSFISSPAAAVLPDVIEISPQSRDEEVEERERLRDAAAQSIGLAPVLTRVSCITEDFEAEQEEEIARIGDESLTFAQNSATVKSALGSTHSGTVSSLPLNTRSRPGSLAQLSPTWSTSIPPLMLPPFPTTFSLLSQSVQLSSALPKYYPSSSLRIFTLTKQWRSRYIVLSSPLPSRGSAPTPSHLHLFKSTGKDEMELERLEINDDSIVFVAEEEVGGRKSVIKVGGLDVGALRKELNYEEAGRTMWLLQIVEPSEAQKWIAAIKSAILRQRSMRAGLGYPTQSISGIEPRGDMDVMLSMRAQGLISSPTSQKFTPSDAITPTQAQPHPHSESNPYASSVSSQSQRERAPAKPAVSTLKGLFNSSARPRSASRATSIEIEDDASSISGAGAAQKGNHLLSLIRSSNGIADPAPPSTSSGSQLPLSTTAARTNGSPELHGYNPYPKPTIPIHRRIMEEPSDNEIPRSNRSVSVSSLQPPPRKRPWTYQPGPAAPVSVAMYNHVIGNASMAGSFGVGMGFAQDFGIGGGDGGQASPTGNSFGSPDARARASSMHSVSTLASGENAERSLTSPKRRSRQGAIPRMLSPPRGPPPSVPPSEAPAEPRTSTSSSHSATSVKNVVSSIPIFSKRTSTSSSMSVSTSIGSTMTTTTSRSHSQSLSNPRINGWAQRPPPSTSHPASSHRASIPPPQRPAPNFAPPPAPAPAPPSPPESPTKTTFRETVAQRALRPSVKTAPKPPPSSDLPPRPDEQQNHSQAPARRGSTAPAEVLTSFFSITGGSPRSIASPFPPPDGPLPPPPPPSGAAARRASIKQRLRILSAPPSALSPLSSTSTSASASTSPSPSPATLRERPITIDATAYSSTPSSPIGEKITTMQNDPSFLMLHSPPRATSNPSMSSPKEEAFSIPISIPTTRQSPDIHGFFPSIADSVSGSPEMMPLSPPPRRASRHIFAEDLIEEEARTPQPQQPHTLVEGDRIFARQSSVPSLHSVGA